MTKFKQLLIAMIGGGLGGAINAFLCYRGMVSAVNRRLDDVPANKKIIIYKTPAKAGIVEWAAMLLLLLLIVAVTLGSADYPVNETPNESIPAGLRSSSGTGSITPLSRISFPSTSE